MVEAQPKAKISPAVREKLLSQLQQVRPQNAAINIKITLVEQLEGSGESQYILGGGLLNSSEGNCTAGFTLRNSSGERGIATAHHCLGDIRTYRNHSGDAGRPQSSESEHMLASTVT
jgi:hypothetical protein